MGFLWIFLSFLLYKGTSAVDPESVSVMEGDSVTLNTGVIKNQEHRIKWYYYDTRIAQITGDLRKICTDVQCNEDTERFRDRLKLDHQTGSLTIMNIRNTDSGEYQLMITSGDSDRAKIFSVNFHGVSAAERDEVNHRRIISEKIFHVSVTDSDPDPDSGSDPDSSPGSGSDSSSGVVAGIVVVLLVSAAVGVIYYRRRISRNDIGEKQQSSDSVDPVEIPVSEMQHFLQTREKTRGHVI